MTKPTLRPGDTLRRGESITSPNGRFYAIMQNDGNFVVYDQGRALWSSRTVGSSDRVVMQEDGNLVVYSGGKATWASGTMNKGHHCDMQDDGSANKPPS